MKNSDDVLKAMSDDFYERIMDYIISDMMKIQKEGLTNRIGVLISQIIIDKIVELGVSHKIKVINHTKVSCFPQIISKRNRKQNACYSMYVPV